VFYVVISELQQHGVRDC